MSSFMAVSTSWYFEFLYKFSLGASPRSGKLYKLIYYVKHKEKESEDHNPFFNLFRCGYKFIC